MDFWQDYGLGVLGLIVIVFIVNLWRGRAKKPTKVEVSLAEEMARAVYDSLPKCVCGEIARHPAPVLKRDRGAWDWLRTHFAAPPRYKRATDAMQPPVLCASHAHVADALMDEFIFRIRSEYSGLNARVAAQAAGFEQEALLKCVGDSLTELQKRATRRSTATIRVLPMKTGTDDAPSDG